MPRITFLKSKNKPTKLFDLEGNKIDFGREVAVVDLAVPVPPISEVLDENDWATIKEVCEAGEAGNYWAVGDVKKVTGGDTHERSVAIVDMTGLYSKHVVFQFMDLTDATYAIDADSFNDYSASDMNVTYLAAGGAIRTEILDEALSAELTDTTVKVAQNGNIGATLVEVTNKLFLPAEREVWTTLAYSVQAEFDALATFEYWQTNTANADHVLKSPADDTAHDWWTRSPREGGTVRVCSVAGNGSANYFNVSTALPVSSCFSF